MQREKIRAGNTDARACLSSITLSCMHALAEDCPATDTRSRKDLRAVKCGTATALLSMMVREFASVGAPDWWARATDLSASSRIISMFDFGFNQGSENRAGTKSIFAEPEGNIRVMVFTVRCLLHELHVIVGVLLTRLDAMTLDSSWGPPSLQSV